MLQNLPAKAFEEVVRHGAGCYCAAKQAPLLNMTGRLFLTAVFKRCKISHYACLMTIVPQAFRNSVSKKPFSSKKRSLAYLKKKSQHDFYFIKQI